MAGPVTATFDVQDGTVKVVSLLVFEDAQAVIYTDTYTYSDGHKHIVQRTGKKVED